LVSVVALEQSGIAERRDVSTELTLYHDSVRRALSKAEGEARPLVTLSESQNYFYFHKTELGDCILDTFASHLDRKGIFPCS